MTTIDYDYRDATLEPKNCLLKKQQKTFKCGPKELRKRDKNS